MKSAQSRSFASIVASAITIIILLVSTLGHAQTTPPTQTYNGGTGVWDLNTTANWNGSNKWNGGDDNALFNGTTNTVTIDNSHGQVTADTLTFGSSGATIIQGGTLEENPFTAQNYETGSHPNPGTENFIVVNGGSGPVTISSPILVSDLGENQQDYLINNSSSLLTIENLDFGAYTVNPAATAVRRINLEANGAGAVTLDGTYTTSAGHGGSFVFDAGNTFNITSNANFANFAGGNNAFAMYGNTLNINNSTFTAAQYLSFGSSTAGNVVNLQGAQTIKLQIYDSTKNSGVKATDGVNITGEATINQSTANLSSWTGSVNQDGSNMTLSAVSGGRLNFSGNLAGDTPAGLIKTGAGTVVLSSATGNSYDERDGNGHLQPTSTTAADIQQGTLLITNTSGSAFGIASNGDSFYSNTGSHNNVVKVESGATLGGNGFDARPVVGVAAGSILAPGDAGQSGLGIAPSIGTLHLTGGITASTGLTLAFKLAFNNATNDKLDLGTGAFSLTGPITVDINNLGEVPGGTNFTLASASGGLGAWSDVGATFTFAPLNDGERVESFNFNTVTDTFSVRVVPEPSMWALLGLGMLTLVWQVRRKRSAV